MMTRSMSLILAIGLAAFACEGESASREFGGLPRSLDGTELDGRFAFDARGDLVFDDGAQQAFDYLLTAEGELDPAELDAWATDRLRASVDDERRRAQVLAAWTAYVSFRSEAAALLGDPAGRPDQIEQRLLDSLDAHLGGTPFAAAERRRIVHGFALHRALALPDREARAAALALLDADEARRFANTRAGRYLAGQRAVEQARRSQADPDTIAALRVQHFDAIEPGAAERLAALDAKRAAWTQRVSEFRTARERLQQQRVGAELDAAIASLEASRFSPAERRRIHALDRVTNDH